MSTFDIKETPSLHLPLPTGLHPIPQLVVGTTQMPKRVNAWNGTAKLSFKDTKVILNGDHVDMFTNMEDFKSEGSSYIVNASSVEGSGDASGVSQGSERAHTGSYGKWTRVWLRKADRFLGFPYLNSFPPPGRGFGQHHSGGHPTLSLSGMILHLRPDYRH